MSHREIAKLGIRGFYSFSLSSLVGLSVFSNRTKHITGYCTFTKSLNFWKLNNITTLFYLATFSIGSNENMKVEIIDQNSCFLINSIYDNLMPSLLDFRPLSEKKLTSYT